MPLYKPIDDAKMRLTEDEIMVIFSETFDFHDCSNIYILQDCFSGVSKAQSNART